MLLCVAARFGRKGRAGGVKKTRTQQTRNGTKQEEKVKASPAKKQGRESRNRERLRGESSSEFAAPFHASQESVCLESMGFKQLVHSLI